MLLIGHWSRLVLAVVFMQYTWWPLTNDWIPRRVRSLLDTNSLALDLSL